MDQKPPQMTMVKCLIRLESRTCRLTKQVNCCSTNFAGHEKLGEDSPEDLSGDSDEISRKFCVDMVEARVKAEAEVSSTQMTK